MATIISDNYQNPNIWTDREIQQVLSIIDTMNLSKDLTPQTFEPTVIKMINHVLLITGHHKTLEQVDTVLASLKMSYFKSREALLHGIKDDLCPYYDSLDKIWGSSIDSKPEEDINAVWENADENPIYPSELSDEKRPWSDAETIALLNLVHKMNLVLDFRHRLLPLTFEKLVTPLAISGYVRTCKEIVGKLESMRNQYLQSVRAGRTPQAIIDCPFFDKIDQMFEKFMINYENNVLQTVDHDYEKKFETLTDPMDHNTQKLDKSDLIWQPIKSFTDSGGAIFASHQDFLDDRTAQNYIGNEFEKIPYGDTKRNGCHNNPVNTVKNSDTCLNQSSGYETSKLQNNGNCSFQNHIEWRSVDKKRLYRRVSGSNIPEYIKVVKGKSKFILKKMDEPSCMKSTLPSYKPFSHSPNQVSNIRSTKLSPLHVGKSPSPIKITMCRKLKSEPKPHPPESPILLDSTCQQTDTTNSGIISETMKTIMERILNHQVEMQQQHHLWMERQFEIQRNHDLGQRKILLEELREFRKELRDVTKQLFSS